MAVLPVSSVRFNDSTAVNFGRRRNKESENKENNYKSQKASGMVTVPAALLLALATSAYQPVSAQSTENRTKVEMASSVGQSPNSTTAPRFQDVFHKLPYYSAAIQMYEMKMSLPVKTGSTLKGNDNLVYASCGNPNDNLVEYIFLIPDGYKETVDYVDPPMVDALIYHNLGDPSKDFCGVAIEASSPQEDGTYRRLTYEVRLNNETANMLIDLIAGDSKFRNAAGLRMIETTSPKLKPTKIWYF